MIEAATDIYEFPMSDRNPLERWSFDRITLLGDAAHPMYPIGSNGGSQAILDAECITECLVNETDMIKALQTYEQTRLTATSKIVLQNRQMGPEQVMQIAEDRAPNGFKNLKDEYLKQNWKKLLPGIKKLQALKRIRSIKNNKRWNNQN